MNADRTRHADANAVAAAGGARQPRNVAPGMQARREEERMDDDLLGAGLRTRGDAVRDRRRDEIEMRNGHETIRQPFAKSLRDARHDAVRLVRTAAVIDQQDGATSLQRHFASAWPRSSQRSPASSSPTERRTTASVMPLRRFSSGANAA